MMGPDQRNAYFIFGAPVLSAALLIATLPPFALWPLVFVALVPIYLFLSHTPISSRAFGAGVIFGITFSGVISLMTLAGFNWIEGTGLFSNLVRILIVPIVLAMGIISGFVFFAYRTLCPFTHDALGRALLFSATFPLMEGFVSFILLGQHYGSLAYAGIHFEPLRAFAGIGGGLLISFLVALGNALIAESLIAYRNGASLLQASGALAGFVVVVGSVWMGGQVFEQAARETSTPLTVSLIQIAAHDEDEAFGSIEDGSFVFATLENVLTDADLNNVDLVVYPFSPWIGVLSDELDNDRFNKNVVGMDYETFGAWQARFIPPRTTFLTWSTTLRNRDFYGEVIYWQRGVPKAVYQKQQLFPFFDYTPLWAARMGIYSTPIDLTKGNALPLLVKSGQQIGTLICSEISSPAAVRSLGSSTDIIVTAGSEAMFAHALARTYSLRNAQMRAAEFSRPVIRGSRSGPSGIFDASGKPVLLMPDGFTGIATATLFVGADQPQTLYAKYENTPLGGVLVVSLLYAFRKRLSGKRIATSTK